MAEQDVFEFSAKYDVEIEKSAMDQACKVLDNFYNKYSNKKMKIDTSDMVKTAQKGISAVQKLYKQGLDSATKGDISWWSIEDGLDEQFNAAREKIAEFFKEAKIIFSDESVLSALDENLSETLLEKFSQGISVVAVDLGERIQYLRSQILDVVEEFTRLHGYDGMYGDGTIDFKHGDLDSSDITRRIDLIERLIDAQSELEAFNGKKFEDNNNLTTQTTEYLRREVETLRGTAAELDELNLTTTSQLQKRKKLINEATKEVWGSTQQKDAIESVHNESQYDDNIQVLREFIEERKQAIQELKDNESELFSADGIGDYVKQAESEIQKMESYLSELQKIKNDDIGDAKPVDTDFSKVVEELKLIKKVITELKDAFTPFTDAMADSESALHKMVTSNVDALNELIDKFREVHLMVDSLNKKEFNITNITQEVSMQDIKNAKKKAKVNAYDQAMANVQELFGIVEELEREAAATASMMKRGMPGYQKTSEYSLHIMNGTLPYNLDDIRKAVTEAKTDKGLVTQIAALERVVRYLNEINQLRNDIRGQSWEDILPSYMQKQETDAIQERLTEQQKTQNTQAEVNSEAVITRIKTLREQVSTELIQLRQQIEATFDFSTIEPNFEHVKSITDGICQQFEELQSKIKALDFNIDIPEVVLKQDESVQQVAQAMSEEGQAAQEATPKKNDFTEANQRVAESMKETAAAGKVAADSMQEEAQSAEAAATTMQEAASKIEVSQEEIINKYKQVFGGTGKVNANLASRFNQAVANANIDVSSIDTAFSEKKSETVGKGDEKQVITYDVIKLIAKGTDELGRATTVTREYEVATGALIKQMGAFKTAKDTFDISKEIETANSKVAELEKRMGTFKIDLSDVKEAAKNITDDASLDVFEKALDGANQKLKELKATLKSTHSLDPVTNAESMMSNLDTTVEKLETNIKKFSDIEGFDKLETSLTSIREKIQNYNDATDGMAKAQIVQDVNKEIAKFNANLDLVQAKYTEENRVLREQQQEYNKIIALQNKLYADKVKLAKAEHGSADEQILQGRVQARQEEYDATLDAISGTENYNAVKEKEKQLNTELAAVVDERIQKEEGAKNNLSLDIEKQTSALAKQESQWEKNGQLTNELITKIQEMRASLDQITSSEDLSAWKKQWGALKDEVMQTKYQVESLGVKYSDISGHKKFSSTANATLSNLGENNVSGDLKSKISQYEELANNLEKTYKAILYATSSGLDASALVKNFQETTVQAEKLKTEIQDVFKETQRLESISDDLRLGKAVPLDDFDSNNIKASMIAYASAVSDGKAEILGFNAAGTEMYGVINRNSDVADKFTVSFDRGTNKLHAYTTGVKEASNEWTKFRKAIGDGAKNIIGMYVGFQEGVQAIRTGVNYVKEIDLAMTELKKVTDETDESYKQFLQDAASASSIIGSTVSDFTEATATFARLGYTMDESASMAETAIIYKNVADGLDTVEESSESIISTMMAFGIEADNTMSIIDKYNEVGKLLPELYSNIWLSR